MMLIKSRLDTVLFILAALISAQFAVAGESPDWLSQVEGEKLYEREAWRALMHYHGDRGEWRSHADDERFFLSPQGESNPRAEMLAAIEAVQQPATDDINDHPQCRFPARFYWLKQRLPALATQAPLIHCEKFQSWYEEMDPAGISLVFPAAYINSPSSMFGHTFIRIDRRQQTEKTRLLAYSISYAAEVPEEGQGAAFVWKGLFGGYPGLMTGAAYYDKVIEYNDLEARDIWEYPLNLSQEETDQLIRHVWELQHMVFHYYFFDENCSYRLLSLLDVARPGLKTTLSFSTHAIPADTVRILEDKGLFDERIFRPSALSDLRFRERQLNRTQRKLARELTQGERAATDLNSAALDTAERVEVIDFSYDYLRYRAQREPYRRGEYAPRSLALLSQRSQLPAGKPAAVPEPVSPEQGHKTARWDVGYGELEEASFVSLRLRPAFHDLLDNDAGYVGGAQIDFLSLDARHYSDAGHTELERFSVLDIKAFSPRTTFFKPLSWRIETGWKRYHELPRHRLRFQVEGGAGITSEWLPSVQTHLMVSANLRSRAGFQSEFEGGAGLEAAITLNLPGESKLMAKAASWNFEGTNFSDGTRYSLGMNVPVLNVNNAVRLEAERDELREQTLDTLRLGWVHYF